MTINVPAPCAVCLAALGFHQIAKQVEAGDVPDIAAEHTAIVAATMREDAEVMLRGLHSEFEALTKRAEDAEAKLAEASRRTAAVIGKAASLQAQADTLGTALATQYARAQDAERRIALWEGRTAEARGHAMLWRSVVVELLKGYDIPDIGQYLAGAGLPACAECGGPLPVLVGASDGLVCETCYGETGDGTTRTEAAEAGRTMADWLAPVIDAVKKLPAPFPVIGRVRVVPADEEPVLETADIAAAKQYERTGIL